MGIQKGKLKNWNDDKGFGFIKQDNGEHDIFVHISALKGMVRKPVVGDIIHYEIGFDSNGKNRAVNAKIEGVGLAMTLTPQEKIHKQAYSDPVKRVPFEKPHRNSKPQRSLNPIPILLVIGVIITVSIFNKTPKEKTFIEPVATEQEMQIEQFQCKGKVRCAEMSSYEEAIFYLRNCPNTKMDGDGDGQPCEQQF